MVAKGGDFGYWPPGSEQFHRDPVGTREHVGAVLVYDVVEHNVVELRPSERDDVINAARVSITRRQQAAAPEGALVECSDPISVREQILGGKTQ